MTDLAEQLAGKQKERCAHLCMAPDCNVITLERFCWKHRPPAPAGEWAESKRIKDALERERDT